MLTICKIFNLSTFNQELKIDVDNSWGSELNIEILDSRGRLVFELKTQSFADLKINLADTGLNEGVYFISLSDENKSYIQKIVLKK